MPMWRVGYRYDKLYRGNVDFNGADIGGTIATLADYNPSRHSLMLDWSPSEFTLLRAAIQPGQEHRGDRMRTSGSFNMFTAWAPMAHIKF